MNILKRLNNLKVSTKLLAINLTAILAFGLIVVVVSYSFGHVRKLITHEVVGDVNRSIESSRTSISLSLIFAETYVLMTTYYSDPVGFGKQAEELSNSTHELVSKPQDQAFLELLTDFETSLNELLSQCRVVLERLELLNTAEKDAYDTLDELEGKIAENMIDHVLDGLDPTIMEQLSVIVSGYRESFLYIGKTHADIWPDHYYRPFGTTPHPALKGLDDLLLRIKTLNASDSSIRVLSEHLNDNVRCYKELLLGLHADGEDLGLRMIQLKEIMKVIVQALQVQEEGVISSTTHLKSNIAKVTGNVRLVMIFVSVLVLIIMTVLTMVFFFYNLRRPMNQLSKAIASISAGNFETTLNMGRKDEWAEIESNLNVMAHDLTSFYAEIQENRADLEQANIELRKAEEKYRTVADYNYDMEIWLGPDGALNYVSPSCRRITGYSPEDFVAKPDLLSEIIHRDDHVLWHKHMMDASEQGGEGTDFRVFRKDGRMRWISQVSRLVTDSDGQSLGIRFSLRDITDRKFIEKQLEYETLHDPLTGLSNRVLCLDRIRQAMERAKRRDDVYFAVVFMDLDRFKVINDSHGHAVGDQLLMEVSTRLLKCVRDVDTVSRFGGDEFILLLEDLNLPREGIRAVKRIREALAEPFKISGTEFPISASFGIILSPTNYLNAEELLQNANIAMHHAKDSGRDKIKVFNSRMLDQAMGLMTMENDLRRAIMSNEFFLVFQPIVNLKDSRLYGFEALVRWKHRDKGVIYPGEFISVAESTGLIEELGSWVLGKACQTFVEWTREIPETKNLIMSVNISSRQFTQPILLDQIKKTLNRTNMPASSLKLEITETSIMEHGGNVISKLDRLKHLGINLSIDDFGTGYSSMAYLQKFPLDNLKIDLSFIRHLDTAPENVEIVRAIINLAHSLDLDVVAEGVEKEAHQEILLSLNCEFGQGYLFSRPMAAVDALEFIRNSKI